MVAKDKSAILLESIFKTYFNIEVIEWKDMSLFYGKYKDEEPVLYNIELGGNLDADFNFSFQGEPFHIKIENSHKN